MKKYWIYPVIIALLLVLYYPYLFLMEGSWLSCDHKEQHFPWAAYLAETIKTGQLPFWTNQVQCGFPLLAEGQAGAFYIPNIILYLLFPIKIGYTLNIILHLLFSGLMTYLFIRSLNLSRPSALFGVVIYLFGSSYGGAFYNINSLKVMSWFPLILYLLDRMMQPKRGWAALLLIFSLSQTLLAGYFQYAVYVYIFSALYFLVRAMSFWKERKALIGPSLVIGFSYLAAVVTALPQLILSFELYTYSNRIRFSEGFAYIGSFNPLALISFFIPNLDSIFSGKLYMGVISVFFFVLGIILSWKEKKTVFVWLSVAALLIALGIFSPLYIFLTKWLKFYAFRTPVKLLLFLGFFYSIIAAYGADLFLAKKDEGNYEIKLAFKWFLGLVMAAIAIFSLMSIFISVFYKHAFSLGAFLVRNFIVGKPGHNFNLEYYMVELARYLSVVKDALSFTSPNFLVPFFIIVVSIFLVCAVIKKFVSRKIFLTMALALIILDLRTYPLNFIIRDYESFRSFFKRPAIVDFLKEDKSFFRIFTFSDNVSGLTLPPSYNMIWKIPTANMYSPLTLSDYHLFFKEMGGVNDSTGTTPVSKDYLYRHLKQLGMMSVKYIITDEELRSAGLAMVWSDGKETVYKNNFFMPRFWLAGSVKVIGNEGELLKTVTSDDFEPAAYVYLKEWIKRYYGKYSVYNGTPSVSLVSEGYDYFILDVYNAGKKFLVVSQTYYPGWRALIDGKDDVEVMRANYLIIGIPLEEGHHTVKFYYAPDLRSLAYSVVKNKKR